jgi:hypothetical protein
MTKIDEPAVLTAALQKLSTSPGRFVPHPPLPEVLPAHTVQVLPGAQLFSTITDALDSIIDASEDKPYQVHLGPGVYEEQVQCKSWVSIIGPYPAPGMATISYAATVPTETVSIVTAASHASIEHLAINATGGINSKFLYGVSVDGADGFDISNCQINLTDGTPPGIGTFGVYVENSKFFNMTYIEFSQITVNVTSIGTLAAAAVYALGPLSGVFINHGSLTTTNNTTAPIDNTGWAEVGGQINLFSSSVTGVAYALNTDNVGAISATGCTISGPVGPGVTILPAAGVVAGEGRGDARALNQY